MDSDWADYEDANDKYQGEKFSPTLARHYNHNVEDGREEAEAYSEGLFESAVKKIVKNILKEEYCWYGDTEPLETIIEACKQIMENSKFNDPEYEGDNALTGEELDEALRKIPEIDSEVQNAQSAASDAAASANAASQSASNAAGSATTASNAASNAVGSATAAANSASTASTKASEAATSASNASNSASTASTKASEAATSAGTASNAASNAASSATAAANSAAEAKKAAESAMVVTGLAVVDGRLCVIYNK